MDENQQLQLQNGSFQKNGGNRGSRPSSIYDNCKENGHSDEMNDTSFKSDDTKNISTDLSVDNERDKSPTQEFLLKTTVPQNLAAANLAGRHTPTRNSLRHSRMIVMSRTGTMSRSYLPPVIRHHRLATVIVTLQTLLGVTICCVAAWLLIWTPNLRRRDNPYWSGLPLLASGTFGLLFLCCCRRDRPGTLKGYIINGTKILSVLLSVTAAAVSFIASVFALIHILMLASMTCESKIQLNETCFCQTGGNATHPLKTFHYSDITCPDVDHLFTILIIFSCVVNFVAGLISLWYAYLHCYTKYNYTYSKVRTKSNRTIVTK